MRSDPYVVRRCERRRVERRRIKRRVRRRVRTRGGVFARIRKNLRSGVKRASETARRAQRGEPLRDPLETRVRGDVQRGTTVVRACVQEGSERRVRLVHRAPHDELRDFRRAETARRVQQRVSVRRRDDARIDAQAEQTFLRIVIQETIRFVVLNRRYVDACVRYPTRVRERP